MNRRFAMFGRALILSSLVCFIPALVHSEQWSDADRATEKAADKLYQAEEYKDAEVLFRHVRDRHPESASALLYHVKGLIGLGRYREALEESNKAAEIDPDSSTTLEWVGICQLHLRHYEEAIGTFKKSLELNSDEVTTSIYLAVAYQKIGNQKKADEIFNRVIIDQGEENRCETFNRIADTFHQIGDSTEAVAWWRKSAVLGDYYAAQCLSWAYSGGYGVPQDGGEANYWLRICGDTFPWFPRLPEAEQIINKSHGWVLVLVVFASSAILPLLTIRLVAFFVGRKLTTDPTIHWTERARRSYSFQVLMGLCVFLPFLYGANATFYPASFLPISRWWLWGGSILISAACTNFVVVSLLPRYQQHPDSYFRNLQNVAAHLFIFAPVLTVFILMASFLPSEWGVEAWLIIFAAILAYAWLQFGGWIRLGRLLFLLYPANAELALAAGVLARQHGRPEPSVWMFRWRKANAFAFIFSNGIIVTEKLYELLSPQEMKSILAHEMAHLWENLQTRLLLFFTPLLLLPFFTIPLWVDSASWYPLAACYVLLLVFIFIMRRRRRRMEETADAFGKASEETPGAYPQALARLYEANLVPAVMPGKRKAHPHLYDRLVTAGITPDYPRPKPPSRFGWIGTILLLVLNVVIMTVIWLLLF